MYSIRTPASSSGSSARTALASGMNDPNILATTHPASVPVLDSKVGFIMSPRPQYRHHSVGIRNKLPQVIAAQRIARATQPVVNGRERAFVDY